LELQHGWQGDSLPNVGDEIAVWAQDSTLPEPDSVDGATWGPVTHREFSLDRAGRVMRTMVYCEVRRSSQWAVSQLCKVILEGWIVTEAMLPPSELRDYIQANCQGVRLLDLKGRLLTPGASPS